MSAEANGTGTPKVERQANDAGDPDVLLDVSNLKIEELQLELDDLRAHVSLRTELAGFVKVDVGVDAYLNHVKLGLKGADVQAILKVRLERILDTFNRALTTMDNNPELVLELIRHASELADFHSEQSTPDKIEGAGKLEDIAAPSSKYVTSGALKKAKENGIDIAQIRGTGKDGRILVRDVSRTLSS